MSDSTPQLRFDRQGDGVDIRPLAPSSRFQRRGDFRPVQPDFDPIGRDGYPFDNFQDEAFHLDGRRGEPSLGKRESVAQGRIKGASLKIERRERITDVADAGCLNAWRCHVWMAPADQGLICCGAMIVGAVMSSAC
jgi:hypothetical protein